MGISCLICLLEFVVFVGLLLRLVRKLMFWILVVMLRNRGFWLVGLGYDELGKCR